MWGIYKDDGKFEWKLRIKPEPSMREGLEMGSGISRFDSRLGVGGNRYINPFTGEVGSEDIGTHISLENPYRAQLLERDEYAKSINRRLAW